MEETTEVKKEPEKNNKEEKGDKTINAALKILGIFCVLLVIIGLSFILIFSSDTKDEVKVPSNLVGLSEKNACKIIKEKGLVCKVKYTYDKDYNEDIVLSISPSEESTVKEGNTVTITVSSFQNTIILEDYPKQKKNVNLVKEELEAEGIRVVTTPQKVTEEDNIEENTIISQSIEPGSRIEKNSGVIELVYATLITVYPDFTDGSYTKDLIQQFCDDNKIECIFKLEEDNNYNEGAIIFQSREIGTEVKTGSKLTITIATNKIYLNQDEEIEGN